MTNSGKSGSFRDVSESFEAMRTHSSGTPKPRKTTPHAKPSAFTGRSTYFMGANLGRRAGSRREQRALARCDVRRQHALLAALQEAQPDGQGAQQPHQSGSDLDTQEPFLGPVH